MRLPTLSLPRSFVIALLASFYVLAFIVSPYWLIPEAVTGKFTVLILTLSLGMVWAYFSAGTLDVRFDARSCLAFIVLVAGLVILNYRPVTSGLPWRGDEDYHIRPVLDAAGLIGKISRRWLLLTLGIFIVFLYTAWKKPRWSIFVGGFLAVAFIAFFFNDPFQGRGPSFYLRYPFINYWLLAVVAKSAMLISNPYQEAIFRIVPLLAAAGIAWLFSRSLTPSKNPFNLLWGISVAAIPVVHYYSSILYLELPAAFLMTVVCLRIKSLLEDSFDKIRGNPGWYALILIGFIKETAIPFLFCFLACRMIVSLVRRRQVEFAEDGKTRESFVLYLARELNIAFLTLFPSFLYLLLRSTLASTRSFVPDISRLWDFVVYQTIWQSFVEQFGIFLLLFLAGCVLLIMKREYSTVFFFLLICLAIPLFHAVDDVLLTGYSRFNLFVLPSILAGATVFIRQFAEQKKGVGILLACVSISISLLISPINPDGSKKPLWGSYLTDISDHYYPYREALSWLKEAHGDERVLFAGLNFPYYFDFYFRQLDWHPEYEVLSYSDARNTAQDISGILVEAEMNDFNVVLYHVLGKDIPSLPETSHFQQEKIIRNDAHLLVIYTRSVP